MKKQLFFVVNPKAGQRRKESFPDFVQARLNHQVFTFDIAFTQGQGHATTLAQQAVKDGADMVVAVGGDGTINEVARSLIGTTTALGIVPSGSGNGLARHLNIPLSFKGAIEAINEGNIVEIDTVKLNDQVFVSIAGVGYDALIAEQFAKDKHRGFFTYFKLVASLFPGYEPQDYTLTIDEKPMITTKALFISLANSNQFGYNTIIAPNAQLNDGMIDVCIVQKPTIFELPIIINLLFLNKIHHSRQVKIFQANKLSLGRTTNPVVNLDGEPVQMDLMLQAEVNPLSLKVAIPTKTRVFDPAELVLSRFINAQKKIQHELKKLIG
ncbi:MAG: diacylglycerol kinase family protein [Bacteroidales bacterium]|jgi:YegS/Rv2252/BmrU family lipid kinase|nr:diacylglycerol kinase family lipid kinase [Bacteroidales bacterium]MDD3700266.1 diacylglycerol kinase family lipid kinase [Bacteroidales bacterium]MDY0368496.1 diacylglycerol kinase family lipid kinase [Bacteroidales bacterium]